MHVLSQQLRGLLASARLGLAPSIISNACVVWFLGASVSTIFDHQGLFLLAIIFYGFCLYLFGMWGNDSSDARWDAEHCPDRPVPQGKVKQATLRIAMLFAVLGAYAIGLIFDPSGTFLDPLYTLIVLLVIFAYNKLHHRWKIPSIILMGACRGLWVWNASELASNYLATCYPCVVNDAVTKSVMLLYALSLALYTAICTWVASDEAHNPQRRRWAGFLLTSMCLLDAVWMSLRALVAESLWDALLPLSIPLLCFFLILFLSKRGHRVT